MTHFPCFSTTSFHACSVSDFWYDLTCGSQVRAFSAELAAGTIIIKTLLSYVCTNMYVMIRGDIKVSLHLVQSLKSYHVDLYFCLKWHIAPSNGMTE